jgi:hypothetical protein
VVAAVVAGALLAAMLVLSPAAAHRAVPPATEEGEGGSRPPLSVSIETLSPSTVPRRGEVTMAGTITNRSKSTWTGLRVYLFASTAPMTTSAELEEATATNETLEVGPRLTEQGLYDEVDDLDPGESTDYRVSVRRRDLPFDAAGVYWIGVHVLGTNEEGRLDGADGRARTFIPLVKERAPAATLSLVVPLRAPVRRTAEGRLTDIEAWSRRLGEDGRLDRLVELAGTASDAALTWVVDPAVLQAARSLAEGNPAFDLAPTIDDETDPTESPSSGTLPTESLGPVDGDAGAEDPSEELTELSAEAEAAEEWLVSFVEDAADRAVLALPYGDVDVATLLRGDFGGTYGEAHGLSAQTMEELGVEAEAVVAPMDGLLPNAAVGRLHPDTTLLLSERAADSEATTIGLPHGGEAVLTSDVARVGGPTPTPPFGALALRQRILGEAAVHGLTAGPDRPLVVSTPEHWNPGDAWRSGSFFAGFDVPWIRTVNLPVAAALSETADSGGKLHYGRGPRRREIPAANVRATEELVTAGSTLGRLLTRNDTIDDQVARAAMLGSSAHARRRPRRAELATREISGQVHRRLSRVYVEGSPLVTMSSETGNFSVTVVNGLEEPVTVGIEAVTGTDELEIRAPNLVSLGPGQRASVRLAVTATGTGVHSVRVVPTTEDGRPLGRSTRIKVRSSQVGLVIWLVMGIGAAVFVVALGARIVRRLRRRGATPGPRLPEPSP